MFVGTALLAAVAPHALYLLPSLFQLDWTRPPEVAFGAIVFGALFGIVAAWTRVFTHAEYLSKHPRFRRTISIGLVAGILATASIATFHLLSPQGSSYMFYVCLVASIGACLLFLGTVSP
jgi:hypothetical protein